MSNLMTSQRIRQENQRFQGTGGVSQYHQGTNFVPAFRDTETGRTELSRFIGGMPAPIHLLCGVPDEWVVTRTTAGAVTVVKSSVVAGFLHGGRFYTRDEAVRACTPTLDQANAARSACRA